MLHKPGLRAHPSASVSPSTIGRGTSVRAGQAPGTRFPSDKVPDVQSWSHQLSARTFQWLLWRSEEESACAHSQPGPA